MGKRIPLPVAPARQLWFQGWAAESPPACKQVLYISGTAAMKLRLCAMITFCCCAFAAEGVRFYAGRGAEDAGKYSA